MGEGGQAGSRIASPVASISIILLGVGCGAMGVYSARAGLSLRPSKDFIVVLGGAAIVVIGLVELCWYCWHRWHPDG